MKPPQQIRNSKATLRHHGMSRDNGAARSCVLRIRKKLSTCNGQVTHSNVRAPSGVGRGFNLFEQLGRERSAWRVPPSTPNQNQGWGDRLRNELSHRGAEFKHARDVYVCSPHTKLSPRRRPRRISGLAAPVRRHTSEGRNTTYGS